MARKSRKNSIAEIEQKSKMYRAASSNVNVALEMPIGISLLALRKTIQNETE